MKRINIGLLGYGTVGSGVATILINNQYDISTRTGSNISIKKAFVRNLLKERPFSEQIAFTNNPDEIIEDPEIDIIVEVMGGIEPARSYIIKSLQRGKHIVTANKDLLALHGDELFQIAEQNKRELCFEASVAGGIPIIAAIKQSLTANRLFSIMGIINGTTNYILSAMTEQGRDFQDVLQEAQELGYAEADPTSDIEGIDAARKLAILSTLAFNTKVNLSDVFVEGITKITATDIQYAKELDCVIKLLAIAKNRKRGIEVRVHPALLPKNHPLATVSGVYNAIYLTGDAIGEAMFYGQGAGSLPTGSAVVSDIIQIVKNIASESKVIDSINNYRNYPIKAAYDFTTSYYIRLKVKDEPRVFATMALYFAEAGISFKSIIQKPRSNNNAEIVLVTHPCKESQLRQALDSLSSYEKLDKIYNVIRLEANCI
ncbi:MAG: homoserine dehydrogenase [Peptococcaceae bacterium]|nr:homoserine dehydrogenase [Peptococcaceae bacterium]